MLAAKPSLARCFGPLVLEEYSRAVRLAARQTRLENADFPPQSPFTVDELLDELLDEDFLPFRCRGVGNLYSAIGPEFQVVDLQSLAAMA